MQAPEVIISGIISAVVSLVVGSVLKSAFMEVLCNPALTNSAFDSCSFGTLVFYIIPGIATFIGVLAFLSKYT